MIPRPRPVLALCEVCESRALFNVLDLGDHPLCDDLIPIGSGARSTLYPIVLDYCPTCRTVFQRYQVKKEILFPPHYHYRARVTGSVIAFMKDLVQECEERLGSLAEKTVLDIGCNDGTLLNLFREMGCRTIGIDPTNAVREARDQGHVVFQNYFTPELARALLSAGLRPDLITFTNVFAHIENLPELLDAVRILAGKSTTIIIENQYLGAIIEKSQFDTFYHEHPRTYSVESFKFISKALGLTLFHVEFPKRYGGNIRAWIGSGECRQVGTVDNSYESSFGTDLIAMGGVIQAWRLRAGAIVRELVSKNGGPIPAKAFPGRAMILLKLLDLDADAISAVYEIKGSVKVNHYVPGTRIPILPESDLYKSGCRGPILNLAWHISEEVRKNLRSNGFIGEIVDIK